jgi:glyoxylase-like metal-dependent hydrolase (beta-lactamase superfamily II)
VRPEQIADVVWRLPVYGANVYFVGSPTGWVLVDAAWAWGDCARIIRSAAAPLFGPDARATAILLTHLHPDHDGAALELAAVWGCPVYLHADELPLARAVAAGDLAGIERYGNGLDRRVLVPIMRILRSRPGPAQGRTSIADFARVLEPTAVPDLPDWTWVPTPGHTPGHVAFFRSGDRVLLSGDAVLTVDATSIGGCLAWALGRRPSHAWEAPRYTNWDQDATDTSFGVLAALEPRVLATGHGAALLGDPATRELRALAARTNARRCPSAGRAAHTPNAASGVVVTPPRVDFTTARSTGQPPGHERRPILRTCANNSYSTGAGPDRAPRDTQPCLQR